MAARTRRCRGRPSAAKALRVGWERADVRSGVSGKRVVSGAEGEEARALRSRTWVPMATAGRGVGSEAVEMMPKGMLASEKSLAGSMSGTQEVAMFRLGGS